MKTRAPFGSLRSALFSVPFVAACAINGGNERGASTSHAQSAECTARVIVRLAPRPTDALLADLQRANALELEPQGEITDDLRVYVLRVAGSDEDCVAAIDRLRRDERVRSVDLDARRQLHDE